MKKNNLIIAFLFLFVTLLPAQEKGIGVGLMIGEPTGLSGKYWVSQTNAFDAGVAYSFFSAHKGLMFHVDYLTHLQKIYFNGLAFLPYYGFGGKFGIANDKKSSFAARGVVGIAFLVKEKPIDIFLEVAPAFDLLPATGISVGAALGARYFFVR